MAKKFSLGAQFIEVSDELEAYNDLRHAFCLYADRAQETFYLHYIAENHSLKDLALNCKSQAWQGLTLPMVEGLKLMLSEEIFDIDRELFEKNYCQNYLEITSVCNNYINIFNSIEQELENKKIARSMRKENRTRLEVIGFGMEGFITGMAMSALYDAVSWIAHTAVNAIGNSLSFMGAKVEEYGVFYDPDTMRDFMDAIWKSALNIHYAYIDAVEERTGKQISKYDPADERRALAIHNNLNLLLPDKNIQEKMVVQMLSLNPYKEEYYADIIRNYGDENGELHAIGEFYHIEMNQIKNNLLRQYAKTFNYNNIVSFDDMMEKIARKAEYYGIQDVWKHRLLLENKVKYFDWKYEKLYDQDTGLYIEDKSIKKDIMIDMTENMKTMRVGILGIFNRIYSEEEHPNILGPEELPKGVWFAVTDNTEIFSTVLFIARDGIYYGRGRKISYGKIFSIEVEERKIVINDVIRLSYCSEQIDKVRLQNFFKELLDFFHGFSTEVLSDHLRLPKEEWESAKDERDKVWVIFKAIQKSMWRIERNIYIFDPTDTAYILAMNNISVRWRLFNGDSSIIIPLFWTRASDNYIVYTPNSVLFTENGLSLDFELLKDNNCYVDDKKIYIDCQGEKYLLMDEACDDLMSMSSLLDYFIHRPEKVEYELIPSGKYSYESDVFMEDFAVELTEYMLTRLGDHSRNLFSQFIFLEHYDQSFTDMVEYFRDRSEISEKEPVLFLLKAGSSATLFTLKHVYCIRDDESGFWTNSYELSEIEKIEVDFWDERKIMMLSINKDENSKVPMFALADNVAVANRSVVAVKIANMALNYLKRKMGFPEDNKVQNCMKFIRGLYQESVFSNKTAKRIAYIGETGYYERISKWANRAREIYLSSGEYETIILFYNSSKRRAGSSGFVLTDQSLYIKGKQIERIPIDDILEYRGVSVGKKCYIEIAPKSSGEIRHIDLRKSEDYYPVSDCLSELIFKIREENDALLDALDMEEFRRERKKERRNVPGVMTEEQQEAIRILSDFCIEHQIFDESSNKQIIFNDGSEEFEKEYSGVLEKSKDKPDPIEVPLFLIKDSSEKKLGNFNLSRGTKIIFVTNEYWYDLPKSGLFAQRVKVSMSELQDVEVKKDDNNSGEVKLKFDQESTYDDVPEYVVYQSNSEDVSAYGSFFAFVKEQKEALIGAEEFSDEEKDNLRQETLAMCGDVGGMSKEEIEFCRQDLLAYAWDCSKDAEMKLEERARQLAIEYLDEIIKNVDTLSLDELKSLKQKIVNSGYPFRYTRKYCMKIEKLIVSACKEKIKEQKNIIKQFVEETGLAHNSFGVTDENRIGYMADSLMTLPCDEISILDVPLLAGISEGHSGYIFTSDKFIIYKKHGVKVYPLNQINSFVLVNRIVTNLLGIQIDGKTITVSDIHGKRAEDYAKLLSKILHFLKTDQIKNVDDFVIETIVGNDLINKFHGIAGEKVSELGNAVTNFDVSGTMDKAGDVLKGAMGRIPGKDILKSNKLDALEKNSLDTKPKMPLNDKAVLHCKNCGNTITPGKKFCAKCGTKVE